MLISRKVLIAAEALSRTSRRCTVLHIMVDANPDEFSIASLDMPRTAEEIAGRRFRVRTRGYDTSEVEQFLAEVAADYRRAVNLAQWTLQRVGRQSDPAFDAVRAQLDVLTAEVRQLATRVDGARLEGTPPGPAQRAAIAAWWPGETSLSLVTKRRVSVGPAI
jgi:DivIVA domain-containing protein